MSHHHHQGITGELLGDHYFTLGERNEARTIDPNINYFNELLLPVTDSLIKELDQRHLVLFLMEHWLSVPSHRRFSVLTSYLRWVCTMIYAMRSKVAAVYNKNAHLQKE